LALCFCIRSGNVDDGLELADGSVVGDDDDDDGPKGLLMSLLSDELSRARDICMASSLAPGCQKNKCPAGGEEHCVTTLKTAA